MIETKHLQAIGVLLAGLLLLTGLAVVGAAEEEEDPDLTEGPVDLTLSEGDSIVVDANFTEASAANVSITLDEDITLSDGDESLTIDEGSELWDLHLNASESDINDSSNGYVWDFVEQDVSFDDDLDGEASLEESTFNATAELDDRHDSALDVVYIEIDEAFGVFGGLFDGTDRQTLIIFGAIAVGAVVLLRRD